jgi:recombination protein RecA
MYGEGISKEGSVLDAAANNDIIIKSGAWYSYGDTRIGQGRENAKQYLKDNPAMTKEIDIKIRELFNLGASKSAGLVEDINIEEDLD